MKDSRIKVIVLGGGGHSRSICDILLQNDHIEVVGILDGSITSGFMGIPLLGNDDSLPDILHKGIADHAFVAIGSNKIRKKIILKLREMGYGIVNAISPNAVISPYSTIGEGVAIMAGAVINAGAKIGDGVILNTNCSIDHDTVIGDFCHVAPGCAICGYVTIGESTFLGVGTSVIDSVKVGCHTMIGAGAAVIEDIPDFCTAVGVPAKVIKKHERI